MTEMAISVQTGWLSSKRMDFVWASARVMAGWLAAVREEGRRWAGR